MNNVGKQRHKSRNMESGRDLQWAVRNEFSEVC